ncbi:hypothetical protein BSK20_02085 [SR1 bacterium human oral taxon HOT-345]|nr:hypothetical protein BSK20_02085 [SR1 bacterium human oral taxon HOT-345]
MTSLEAPLGFPGELFLFAGKGVDYCLLEEEEKKEVGFFFCFSLAIEERILIYLLASHSVP